MYYIQEHRRYCKKTYHKIRHLFTSLRCFKYKQTNCMTVTYLRNSILPSGYEWEKRVLFSHITKLVLLTVDKT